MSSRRKLGSHLEWHNGSIRVVVSVPKALQAHVGKTKLKEGLNTDSPALAERRKWPVVARFKAELVGAERVVGNPRIVEALDWRRALDTARHPEGPDDDDDEHGLYSVLLSDRAEEIERSEGLPAALAFVGVVHGTATPLTAHLETFLAEKDFSARYKGDVRRAVGRLASWCAKGGAPEALEAITRKVAGKFISTGLTSILNHRKTINKDISALTSYWLWLSRRGHLADDIPNPWLKQSFEVRRSKALGEDGEARAFTPDEAAKLLHGPATQRMRDIMWIGALSGMRLDEVCRLQVRDCVDGWFAVNARRSLTGEGKTDASQRDVPVHPALEETVRRLSDGKQPDALLINGLPARDPTGVRKPSAAAGQEFVRYRRKMGVDDLGEGQRRSRVTFHSWRHWFVTEALRAGHHLHIVKPVVGHADGGQNVTTGVYFRGGPSTAQFKAVVDSVQPPPMKAPADGSEEAQGEEAGEGAKFTSS
ncbi:MAG: tyrosine-type recombinase/integrase [Phenylobacterium sp.]